MKKTKEVNDKYLKEIYLNILKAIIIMLYFFILNMSYKNVRSEYLEIGIRLFAMIFLFVSIYIFEKAYKKDNGNLAIQGIEILILSTYTLTTEHIINKFKFDFESYSLVASYLFSIYFILKCIIIYTKGKKEMEKEFSDIREIVNKNEPIKKEAIRKNREEKKEVIQEQEIKSTTTRKKETKSIVVDEKKEDEIDIKNTYKKNRTSTNKTKGKGKQIKEGNSTSKGKEKINETKRKMSTSESKEEIAKTNKKTSTIKSKNTNNKNEINVTDTKKKSNANKLKDAKKRDIDLEQDDKTKRKSIKKEVTKND